eukprot:gnl/TRDRNA2_/TRDRNA2_175367_c3_seq8.p1 gnl/TRDRNA2_/TRDRNA2_175367_c3~~gnl/TRDRNA2_/TRDRNA2_175367_c3_seq8.p1  ORF type:complete len:157 (+),score=10.12 gnl/TRDRNA2_/TRDRNA2_175367_c3_seq8:71-541(+)
MRACEKGQQWIAALTMLRQMRQWQVQPNAITHNATISACEKGSQWILATTVLREMQQWRMEPDAIAFEAVIRVCGSVESWLGALEVLAFISGSCVRPAYQDLWFLCLALSTCDKCSHREWLLLLIPIISATGQYSGEGIDRVRRRRFCFSGSVRSC